jgi:hypothetical protein
MPNWCENNLMVTGERSELERFRDAITNEQGEIEILSRLVPVPASSSASEYWGSKWGDCSTNSDGPDALGFSLWFSSAWAPPVEGIAKVSGLFPSLLFVLEFEEPGWDFCGAAAARAGEFEVVEISITEGTRFAFVGDDENEIDYDALNDAVNDLKALAVSEALEQLNGGAA